MGKNLLLFVHGFGGDVSTWGNFPNLINSDPDLRDQWQAEEFSFPTRIWSFPFFSNAPRLQMLADGLRDTINYRYGRTERIVMSCHSLGGLVSRRYLVDQHKVGRVSPVKGLFLFATPNDGAGLANIGRFVHPWNLQLRQLCRNADIIDDLNRDWQQAAMDDLVAVTCFVGSNDKVVSEKSARGHWHPELVKVVLGSNHRNLVKPADRSALQYIIVRNLLRSFRFGPTDRRVTPLSPAGDERGPSLPVARIEAFHRGAVFDAAASLTEVLKTGEDIIRRQRIMATTEGWKKDPTIGVRNEEGALWREAVSRHIRDKHPNDPKILRELEDLLDISTHIFDEKFNRGHGTTAGMIESYLNHSYRIQAFLRRYG